MQELSKPEYNIPVLFHFCSSGIQNNLHATLYHLIIQGKKQQLWKTENQDVLRKLDRLPSKYTDLIELFHRLLDECFVPSRNNTTGNLVILLDGLDDAAVAFPQLHIGLMNTIQGMEDNITSAIDDLSWEMSDAFSNMESSMDEKIQDVKSDVDSVKGSVGIGNMITAYNAYQLNNINGKLNA